MISLRRTTDIVTIRALDAKLFGTDVDQPKLSHLWWLCRDGSKVIGYCGLGTFMEEGKRCGFLSRSGILPEHRGKGLQRRMIRVREAAARKLGASHIITYTSDGNMPSANNLIATGYRLYSPANAWGLEHGLYFTKAL